MRDKQREETRRRLYQAALEIFRRDGVANCRIDDIAQKAEVSRAAFYFHFPTKDDVLLELLRESEQPLSKALSELPVDGPFEKMLDTLAEQMAKFWQDEPRLLVEVATVSLRNGSIVSDREAEPTRVAVTKFFQSAAQRGELSDVLSPEMLTDFFLVNCLAAMVAWTGAPTTIPLEVVLKGVIHLFLTGAKPPAPVASIAPPPALTVVGTSTSGNAAVNAKKK